MGGMGEMWGRGGVLWLSRMLCGEGEGGVVGGGEWCRSVGYEYG